MKILWYQEFLFRNFDLKNLSWNELEDNNEKYTARVFHKKDFKAVWTRESNPTAWDLSKADPMDSIEKP